MTSIAVTASMCASASEVALLVASFMPVFSLNLGATHRGAKTRTTVRTFTRNTPRRAFALMSPHSANVDCVRVEQYCGGNLTRTCRGTETVWAKSSPNRKHVSGATHKEPNGPHRL